MYWHGMRWAKCSLFMCAKIRPNCLSQRVASFSDSASWTFDRSDETWTLDRVRQLTTKTEQWWARGVGAWWYSNDESQVLTWVEGKVVEGETSQFSNSSSCSPGPVIAGLWHNFNRIPENYSTPWPCTGRSQMPEMRLSNPAKKSSGLILAGIHPKEKKTR